MTTMNTTKQEMVEDILIKWCDMHSHYEILEQDGGFALVRTFEISDELLTDYGLSSHEHRYYWAETLEKVQDFVINLKK